MTEKRFYVRIPSNMECRCTFHDERIFGTIVDFSSDGMCILIDSDNPFDFEVGSSIRVKYSTSLELDEVLAPVIIKCDVAVRHIECKSGKYPFMYRLGCQIENTIDSWS